MKFFSDSLVQIAPNAAGAGGNVRLILDPSRIAGLAFDVTQPLVQAMQDAGLTYLGDLILDAICYVVLAGSPRSETPLNGSIGAPKAASLKRPSREQVFKVLKAPVGHRTSI